LKCGGICGEEDRGRCSFQTKSNLKKQAMMKIPRLFAENRVPEKNVRI